MAQEIKVNAEVRVACGSTASRRLRRAGAVPAVLSRVGGASNLLTLNAHDFERMLGRHVSEHLIVTLAVGDESMLALLREIQRDGVSGKVIHADFGEVSRDTKLHVQIPVVLIGDSEGVRNAGGVLEQMLRQIDVACLPGDVVEKFELDISGMQLNDTLLVRDLKLGDAFTVLTHADVPVATVLEPKAEEVVEAAADAAAPAAAGAAGVAATPAQPEVVKKPAKDKEG